MSKTHTAREASAGSADALETRFKELVDAYGASLTRLAGAYELDRSLRDDLVQEILVALWRGLPGFRGDSTLSTWVYRVADNVALKHRRGRSRERARRAEYEREHGDAEDPSAGDAEDPRLLTLRQRIRELPVLDRQLVVLQLEGLDREQMAAITGLSTSNVSTRLSRARAELARRLGTTHEGRS